MPPPEVASARRSAICFCSRSCICCACFIICWMFIGTLSFYALCAACVVLIRTQHGERRTQNIHVLLHLFHVSNLYRKHLEKRLDAFVRERLFPQGGLLVLHRRLRRLARSAFRSVCAGDGDLVPSQLLRQGLEPAAILFEHLAQRLLRGREGEGDVIGGDLDLLRLRDDRIVKDTLRRADLRKQRVLETGLRRRL